jgi:REP element-mobilizing transposase RayT
VVREFELLKYGEATKVSTRRSLAHRPHDHALRLAAKRALRYPPVRFTGEQARAIAHGYREAAADADYAIHALATLPEHTHLVIGRHAKDKDLIARHLKSAATRTLNRADLNPMTRHVSPRGRVPSPWSRKHWCVYIDSVDHMHAAIDYVERNPDREHLPRQRWPFVIPYAPRSSTI